MNIKQLIGEALDPAIPNNHAVELPPNPEWPAAVFEIDSKPEDGWCMGGGYDQNVITVVTMSDDLEDIEALKPQIAQAIAAVPGFMAEEEHGDAAYEADASVYAYFQTFRIRTRKA